MALRIITRASFLILLLPILWNCTDGKWQGQAPITIVPTTTLPVQKQYIGTFELENGVYASNDFVGARLNGIAVTGENEITVLITPENTPINPSPWYAFKLWAKEKKSIDVKLTYLDGQLHRYHPKISTDGNSWELLEDSKLTEMDTSTNSDGRNRPAAISMKLEVGPDTLWVAAQELETSIHNAKWIASLDTLPYVQRDTIGYSREGRPMHLLKIGEADDSKMIMVISRQHPPEVTGYLAMKSFVETLSGDTEVAQKFRSQFNAYVVPMVNPDGVDNGHWRHSMGGRDLNRDWGQVNHPEVRAVQSFIQSKLDAGGKFYFAVDFHSTWEDIYYTINPELKGNAPGLVPKMINGMATELSLDPNIRPGDGTIDTVVTSNSYFFKRLNAESLTYELGDGTPRDLLKSKGEVSALKLMELLISEN